MFGVRHIKFDSMTYIFHYKNGNIKREGRGLSFFYFSPNSSIVAIPIGSNDLPFIFQESTNDYQTVHIQGQISYKITNPKILADVLDFTVDDNRQYKKNDMEKLNQRIINEAQTATSSYIHEIKLKDAIRSAKTIEAKILDGLKSSQTVGMLGIEILGTNILAIQATPEMTRALETETREKLQQEADQAIYERRNFAVEQERKIKESELNTEIAVEEKQKQIAEKKMESEVQKAENERKLREMKLAADIAVENQRKQFIEQKTENDKKEAETQGYVIETTLRPYKEIDWKILTALNNNSDPKFNISLAFRQLAENADKIGNLNISPDLLDSILTK
ncbi:membrane protease subunit, stomatin/prohibitin [Tannerella forsythia]|uniref:Membrane protease subunit, stomatin/prohibitin n=2 Tax=Tannerellaceae TaxID=2005525 RepID=A0A3P1XTJ2_TANFO|nr:membrane protease subunit, stomatin/prohibitin [Tannerella forsythia]